MEEFDARRERGSAMSRFFKKPYLLLLWTRHSVVEPACGTELQTPHDVRQQSGCEKLLLWGHHLRVR